MRRQFTSLVLIVCGVVVLLGGMLLLPAATPTSAQAPEPSPRPTLQPTTPPTAPTAVQPTPEIVDDGDSGPTPVPLGRITGTIIDLRTNAPVAGVIVAVGDLLVVSDANGNYDHWMPSGFYSLALELAAGQGTPTQPAQQIAIGPNDTVVVHLFFTSLAPVVAPAAGAAQPVAPTASVAQPVALPPSLPDTSLARTGAAHPLNNAVAAPSSLPVTAAPVGTGSPAVWLLAGVIMLGLGTLLQAAPRARRKAARPSPDALLKKLLEKEL